MKRPVRILFNRYVRPRLLRAAAEDFPPGLRPRWTIDHPHPIIAATIARRRDAYAEMLRQFAPLMAKFSAAPQPHWRMRSSLSIRRCAPSSTRSGQAPRWRKLADFLESHPIWAALSGAK